MGCNCCVCGTKLGLRKIMIKNMDYLCFDCVKKAGFNPMTWMGGLITSKDEIEGYIAAGGKTMNQKNTFLNRKSAYDELKITHSVGNIFCVDETSHRWFVQDQFGLHKMPIHSFDEVMSYELLEDGDTITKGGLGRAIVGGATFGALGAMVGAATGKRTSKTNCTSMRIRVSLKSMDAPIEYINLLQMKVSKNSAAYKKAFEQAQEITSLLQIMTQQSESTASVTTTNAADEIMKYKKLLDAGAITEEEFSAKKKQLLSE